MKRKSFIQSSIVALTASYLPALPKFQTIGDETLFVSPAFLKTGDIIGITAPAGYITSEEIRSAVQKWKAGVIRSRSGKRSIKEISHLAERMKKEQRIFSKCLMIQK